MESQSNSKPNPENLLSLCTTITQSVETFLDRLTATNHQPPSLANPFPEIIKDETAQLARLQILRTCERLMALVQTPVQWLMFQNMSFADPACIAVAVELGLPEAVRPGLDESTSLEELVRVTGASRDILSRVLRVCTQRLFFEEVAPGRFRHNGMSLQLLVPPVQALIGHCTDDGLRCAAHLCRALKKNNFQGSDKYGETAFSEAFNTDKGLFDYFASEDPQRGQRFALGMAGSEVMKGLTEDMFPFDTLPTDARVVDVGGGRGHVSVRIAEKVEGLRFIVQDEPSMLEAGQAEGIPIHVKDRVEFMPHDFFQEQPVKGADVYLLRYILHDHPDSTCVQILSQVVDAMDEKSRILIDDAVVPSFLGQDSSRYFNLLDIYMLMMFNGKERTEAQWLELFAMVSDRLVLEKVWREPGSGPEAGTVLELRLK